MANPDQDNLILRYGPIALTEGGGYLFGNEYSLDILIDESGRRISIEEQAKLEMDTVSECIDEFGRSWYVLFSGKTHTGKSFHVSDYIIGRNE